MYAVIDGANYICFAHWQPTKNWPAASDRGKKRSLWKWIREFVFFPPSKWSAFNALGDGVATEKNELRAACSQGVAYARATLRYSAANMWLMGKLDKQSFTAWNSGKGGQGNPREGRSVVQYNREIQISLKKNWSTINGLNFFLWKNEIKSQ